MTVILTTPTLAVGLPAAYDLMHRVQGDPYATVMYGHQSIWDWCDHDRFSVAPNLVTGLAPGAMTNDIDGIADAIMGSAYSAYDADDRGLRCSVAAGETFQLGQAFNLRSYAGTPSFALDVWLTHTALSTVANSIIGYAYQTGAAAQWYWADNADGTIRLGTASQNISTEVDLDVPTLWTVGITRVSDTINLWEGFKNGVKFGEMTGAYPFTDPTATSGGAVPIAGGVIGGFADDWQGILHRAKIALVNPASFDGAAWAAEEMESVARAATSFIPA